MKVPSMPIKFRRQALLVATALPLAVGIAACDPGAQGPIAEGDGPATTAPGGDVVAINGAGATFPAPLFQRWFSAYNSQVNPNTQVSYQSVGSGAGLEQYINGTVDFGASEAPIEGDRLESFRAAFPFEPLQIPMTGGFLSFSYNLPGVEDRDLRLSRTTYCGIVTGEITQWSDPAIAADNPDLEIPDLPITFVHRSDGSGTTFVFTNHIDTVCPAWQAGAGTSVDWPVGIGGQGNEGVAAGIEQNEGAIGYLSYAYAALNDIPSALIENQAGNFVEPSPQTAANALLGEDVPDDFALLVPDPSGEDAYPIVGLAWVLIYRQYDDPQTWEAMRSVFDWALGPEGRAIAEELFYVPIPDELVERIQQELDTVQAG
jgi:phosphate transport system substrate-binding protein